jgi:hypothetical protein
LQPAWNDVVSLRNVQAVSSARIAALQTPLQDIRRIKEDESDAAFSVSLPSYTPADQQPFLKEEDFRLQCQCLVHLESGKGSPRQEEGVAGREDVCLFLYEV